MNPDTPDITRAAGVWRERFPKPGPYAELNVPPSPVDPAAVQWCEEDVRVTSISFMEELHDVTFHYYPGAGYDPFPGQNAETVSDRLQELIDRVRAGVEHAERLLSVAATRRAYLLGGWPMICHTCGNPIILHDVPDPEPEWLICDGWAEHETCHHQIDPAREAQHREWTLADAEYEAYLAERNHLGPRHHDQVEVTINGRRVEAIWIEHPDGTTSLESLDGTDIPHGGEVLDIVVTHLSDDPHTQHPTTTASVTPTTLAGDWSPPQP